MIWWIILLTNTATGFTVFSLMKWYANRLPDTLRAIAFIELMQSVTAEDIRTLKSLNQQGTLSAMTSGLDQSK